jgi:glycine C-acetyltransferase
MTQPASRPQLAYLTAVLNDFRVKGTHFRLRVLDDQQAPVCHYDGREVINLASNNYLGLANHPKLVEAAVAATYAFGVGSGAVRTIAGTMRIHMELEERIARFKNVEACVRLHPLRRAQPRFDHRWRTAFKGDHQSFSA